MILTGKELKNVRVYTQSGQHLGKVHDFEIESDTGNVVAYYVKTIHRIKGLFEDSLIIQKNDVIDFDKEKMIVRDRIGKALEINNAIKTPVETPSSPITTKT